MVNRRDVLELVASGEGSGVEFKQSMDSNRRLAQEVVAFRAELQPVSGAAFDELDLRRLNGYFRDIRARMSLSPRTGLLGNGCWSTRST